MKVKLVAADNHWSDEGDSWTLYRVQALRSFKGKAPSRIEVLTYRDSGGFYLDKGVSNDLGGDYLLFLSPPYQTLPRIARGAMQVNYPCGQSGPWAQLTPHQIAELGTLAKHKQNR